MDDKYLKLHGLTFKNEEILRNNTCVCIYCKKEFDYKEIENYISDSDGLTAECPFCKIDCVLPKSYDGYTITKDDLENLYDLYF